MTHGGKRDNRKKKDDDGRGGVRVPGPGKRLGRPKKVQIPFDLNSVANIQNAIAQAQERLRAIHDAADTFAPNATPELWNAIESLRGALRDIAPYAQREHQSWLDEELKRQKAMG